MRASIAIAAGLVAVASAKTSTVTDTVDVTITSCEPTVTNCPYKNAESTWDDWTSTTTTTTTTPAAPVKTSTYDPTWSDWTTTTTTTTPAAPVKTSSWDPAWGDWSSYTTTTTKPVAVTTTAACGVYTAAGPPAWFSLLPSAEYSSIAAKWTGAPPADWCYYTYSTSTLYTSPVAATQGWPAPAGTTPVAAASSAVWSYAPSSPVAPAVATYTGAANSNAGSLALAGLAAAAALVIA